MRSMQQGGKQRSRGRGRGKPHGGGGGGGGGGSPVNLNRTLDSNGPDVKIRGTVAHIYEKYQALARDANSQGDHVGAENYLQHAEHYFRLMAAANQAQALREREHGRGPRRHGQPEEQGDAQETPENGAAGQAGVQFANGHPPASEDDSRHPLDEEVASSA